MAVIPLRPLTPEGLQESVDVWDNTPHSSGGGGSGTDNYNDLSGKPQINGITLAGNKSASVLGLATTGQVNSAVSTATQASSDVVTLRTAVTTNTNNIASVSTRTGTLESNVSLLQTTVGTHTTQIANLQTSKANTSVTDDLSTRVTALEASDPSSSITTLQTRMTTAESDITSLQTNKANVSVTNSQQVAITALQTNKANQSDLTALQTVVGQKASATDVATLQSEMTTLNADNTTVGSVDYKIQHAVTSTRSYTVVATLPTASASTEGAIYIIDEGQPDSGQMYITVENAGVYSWYNVGGADSIDLSGYVKVVDFNAYKQTVTTAIGAVDTKADTNATDIASLSDTVDTKADESDLQQLAARVGVNETNIALKASATDLTALDTRVTTAESAITGLTTSKQDALTFDSTPTEDSDNPVKSGGVYTALATKATTSQLSEVEAAKQDKQLSSSITVAGVSQSTVEGALSALADNAVTVDDTLSTTSENPVQNRIVTADLLSRLKVVSVMPAAPTSDDVVLYVGTTGTYVQGGIYIYGVTEWVLISTADVDIATTTTPGLVMPDDDTITLDTTTGAVAVSEKYKKIWTGHKADWELLTTAEKKQYDEAHFDDDESDPTAVVDAVTDGDMHAVTSNAVFDRISDGKIKTLKAGVGATTYDYQVSDEFHIITVSSSNTGYQNTFIVTKSGDLMISSMGSTSGITATALDANTIRFAQSTSFNTFRLIDVYF